MMNRSQFAGSDEDAPYFRPTRILNFLVITTGASAALCSDGTIDRMIRFVLELKKIPILVLGPEGDEILLSSRMAEKCDLAFDPNFDGHIFSSLKAGLHASSGPVLAMTLTSFANALALGTGDSESAASRTGSDSGSDFGFGEQFSNAAREGTELHDSIFEADSDAPNLRLWKQLENETLAIRRSVRTPAPRPVDVITLQITQSDNKVSGSPKFPIGISASGATRLKDLPASTEFNLSSTLQFLTPTGPVAREIRCPLVNLKLRTEQSSYFNKDNPHLKESLTPKSHARSA